jgi:hypothetical protein
VGCGESGRGLAVADVGEGGGGERWSGRQGGITEALGEGVFVLDVDDMTPTSSRGEHGGLTSLLLFVPIPVGIQPHTVALVK